jgi:hypothetical protein
MCSRELLRITPRRPRTPACRPRRRTAAEAEEASSPRHRRDACRRMHPFAFRHDGRHLRFRGAFHHALVGVCLTVPDPGLGLLERAQVVDDLGARMLEGARDAFQTSGAIEPNKGDVAQSRWQSHECGGARGRRGRRHNRGLTRSSSPLGIAPLARSIIVVEMSAERPRPPLQGSPSRHR